MQVIQMRARRLRLPPAGRPVILRGMSERDDYADGDADPAPPWTNFLLGLVIGGSIAFVAAGCLAGLLIWFLSGLALKD